MPASFGDDRTGFAHRLTAFLSQRLQFITYTSRSGVTKGLKRKGGLGFLPSRLTETDEVRFLRTLDFTGKVVYDIGGYQGLMTIFFAKTARRVITYEANPKNVLRIEENAELNGFQNVFVRSVAIGDRDGQLQLQADPLLPGTASGDPAIAEFLAGEAKQMRAFSTVVTSIDAEVERFGLPEPDFVKIDIEGMELAALRGMEKVLAAKRPELYVELHGTTPEHKRQSSRSVIGFAREHGYRVLDVERNADVTGEEPTGRESHIYCTAERTP